MVVRPDGAGFALRVGRFSDVLKRLFEARGYQPAAFLTACNPLSVKISDSLNIHAQTRLMSQIKNSGFNLIAGIGLDSDSQSNRPGEPSVLALGIKREETIDVARHFSQLALLWCPDSAIPQLLMIPPKSQS